MTRPLYMANPVKAARDVQVAGTIGFIDTPKQQNRRPNGVAWCADNGCFGKGWPGEDKWVEWLKAHAADADTCLFATAPDVVGDAAATLERSAPWLPVIRSLGYPAALVAQDGLEDLPVPWDEFDVLFIGGSTEWKLGDAAARLTAEAKARGKWVHMGRVNSLKRYRYAESIGCDSVDGTYLVFGPDKNLPKLLSWLEPDPPTLDTLDPLEPVNTGRCDEFSRSRQGMCNGRLDRHGICYQAADHGDSAAA